MVSALADLKILDFSRVLAGPFATMLLGDLGANVTKIERPESGDDTRAWGPPFDEFGEATYFLAVNRNKESIALDLSLPSDLMRAKNLAAESDVIIENFMPGVMDRFGLGYEDLSKTNKALVYCSITGFGKGLGASLPGYDLLIQALGGLMSITGTPEGKPQKVGVALVDIIAGLFATVGILSAILHSRATGEGQLVEVNLLSSLLAAMANQGSAYTAAGVVPRRIGNEHPSIAPYGLIRAADRDLVIAVGNDRQFSALCDAIGNSELSKDLRFVTNALRVYFREDLKTELEIIFGTEDAVHWVRILNKVGVPAGVVNDLAAAFTVASDLGLSPIIKIQRPNGTEVSLTRNPISLSRTPATYRSAPPVMPVHTDQ